ncbi:MAG TPA: hypothetical protein P5204_06250 [Kiritimatiellia bacterium]|nr:hypothetical protein [Kiritimatiellia bacterium]
MTTKVSRWIGIALQLALVAALTVLAGATRRHVLDAQRQLTADGSIPFTLESALAFRRIQLVYRDGDLPKVDQGIQYPRGVVARETDTIGVERIYARAAKLWPGTLPLAEKIRWLHLAWFCLAIPGLFFWVKWMGGGAAGGFWAAAFYAVAISAVARATGQELSHENDALPLLLGHLAAAAWARNRAGSRRAKHVAGWISAGLAGLALCAWDMVQFYLLLALGWELAVAIRGRLSKEDLWARVVPLMAVLLAAGLRNPYLRAHGFLFSPTLALGWGTLLAGAPVAQRQRTATRVVLALLPVAGCLALAHFYLPAYGHFGSLLWAKLRFFNVRPENPALLTFEQRILWAPALNSTSWALLWEWFPFLLVLTAVAVWALMRGTVRNRYEFADFPPLLFYLLASLAAFILFFRFHVWLAIFACGIVGLWAGQWKTSGGRRTRGALAALLVFGWLVEARQPWFGPFRWEESPVETPGAPKWDGPLYWGRPNVYAAETEALMDHLRKYVAPEPVLANFGVSAGIAAYGGCPVVLHPKFESADIRRRVREYGEALFKGDEAEFRDWMEAQGATVYVHSLGEFSEIQPGLQMRYMVDALDPATNAAARLFEQRPEELKYFAPQFANRKYRVFRLKRSPVAARLAETLVEQARAALENGDLAEAETKAAHALRMDAENEEAQAILRHATGLRDAGFRAEEDEGWAGEASPLAPTRPWP